MVRLKACVCEYCDCNINNGKIQGSYIVGSSDIQALFKSFPGRTLANSRTCKRSCLLESAKRATNKREEWPGHMTKKK